MELDFPIETIEKLFLKKALEDKRWINILSDLWDKRWFKNKTISLILFASIKFYQKYDSIPSKKAICLLIKKLIESDKADGVNLQDLKEVLLDISNFELELEDDVVSSNLKEFIRRNALYYALFDNVDLLEGEGNYSTIIDRVLTNFDRAQKITFRDVNLGMEYFKPECQKEHWAYILNPEIKIKSGWPSFDYYTNGGFPRDGKLLCLFMAQAGLGKSVFLSNLAVNFLKQNLSVVLITLEMSQDIYAARFDAHISNENINHLKENSEACINRINEFYAKYPSANLIIKEYPPRSVSSRDIEIFLENLKNAGKHIDIIIIDYLNLVLPLHRTDSMFKDGLSVSEELRALSYKFSAPIISAVQCNSEGMLTEKIDIKNVSESRGIAHTCDALFAMWQLPEDRENGIINLRILKNRLGGMVGKISNYKLDPETLILEDISFSDKFSSSETSFLEYDSEEKEITEIERNLPKISADLDIL